MDDYTTLRGKTFSVFDLDKNQRDRILELEANIAAGMSWVDLTNKYIAGTTITPANMDDPFRCIVRDLVDRAGVEQGIFSKE